MFISLLTILWLDDLSSMFYSKKSSEYDQSIKLPGVVTSLLWLGSGGGEVTPQHGVDVLAQADNLLHTQISLLLPGQRYLAVGLTDAHHLPAEEYSRLEGEPGGGWGSGSLTTGQ